MFVLERSGVTWNERFYKGHSYIHSKPEWGSLDVAYKFVRRSDAVSMSYRVDDEMGVYTSVEEASLYGGE
jgi:hypothetical protein